MNAAKGKRGQTYGPVKVETLRTRRELPEKVRYERPQLVERGPGRWKEGGREGKWTERGGEIGGGLLETGRGGKGWCLDVSRWFSDDGGTLQSDF